jgi:tRNA pseudouridine38-40 synthase
MPSKSPRSFSRNLKLTIEYDGSHFFGFQRQRNQPTIQEALEKALTRLLNRPTKITAAAGRTDSGVHAGGQVVNFRTDSALPLKKIQKGLNALLPKEIVVKEAAEAPAGFHARYSARSKTYEYRVLNSETRSPLLNGRVYQYHYPLNLKRMKTAARLLVGRRDFKVFQAAGSNARGSVRRVRRLEIKREGNLLRFVIEADGFLYRMVRNIVGTLLEVGRDRLSLRDFSKAVKSRKRILAGPTVPPQGLCLVSVEF